MASSERKTEEQADRSDTPIYLLIESPDASFWYVIEDKKEEAAGEEIRSSKRQKTHGTDDMTPLGSTITLRESKSDRIRALQLPDIGYSLNYSSLVIFDSRFYLFGGYIVERERGEDDGLHLLFSKPLNGFICLEEGNSSWKKEGVGEGICGAAAFKGNNAIYVAGNELESTGKRCVLLPPPLESTGERFVLLPPPFEDGYTDYLPLLAVADEYHADDDANANSKSKKIFALRPRTSYRNFYSLLSFDPLKDKWEVLDDNLVRPLSPGVVLSFGGCSYLFTFGVRPPREFLGPSSIYVFDIGRREWLPDPIEGLPYDGEVLPEFTNRLPIVQPYLCKMHGHKLALVWCDVSAAYTGQYLLAESSESTCNISDVHWSKFILHCDHSSSSSSSYPRFHAELLSHGVSCVDGNLIQNIAAVVRST